MAAILLVDDHPPLRAGVAAIIERSGRHHVVGEAGTIEEALPIIRNRSPEIAIIDVSLPDGSGIDLCRLLKRERIVARILVLSMHARRSVADSALAAGADGYLLKESTPDYLIHALDEISLGRSFLDHRLRAVTAAPGRAVLGALESAEDPLEQLTTREFEVFRLLAAGKNSKQVGALLRISSKTVDNHRASIMDKLALSSIAELVRLAIRTGIIDP
ncbi:response regulator [Salinispira pacifica]